MGFAPTDVAPRGGRGVERHELIARATGIVRHDRVPRIDRLHEVPDDAVGRDGHLVRGELGHPFLEPRLPRLPHLARGAAVAPGASAQEVRSRIDELAQDQLGVAEDRIVRGIVLVEIALVVGRVNDGLSRRDVGGHAVACEAAADPEHHVSLRQEMVRRAGHHTTTPGAQRQRMIFREGALPLERGHDRNLQELGELEQLRGGVGVHHALAGVDHGLVGVDEHAGRGGDVTRVARRPGGLHDLVLEHDLVTHVRHGHVRGDLDHDRSGTPHLQ